MAAGDLVQKGTAVHVGFGGNKVNEGGHFFDRIQHAFIHIDVDNLCAVFDLL